MNLFKTVFTFICILLSGKGIVLAQPNPDKIYKTNIHSVKFNIYGDQQTMPLYKLNSGEKLELHFDDVDANVKSYYYTYQLCDYNWQPVNLSPFDYLKGFTQIRISNYRFSSIAYTRYTHYQAILPEANSIPSKGGNYLLKVFLDGDTSKLVFTRGMLVLDTKSSVSAQVVEPFMPQFYKTHQRVKFTVNLDGINSFTASREIKVMVLQNYRWDNAQGSILPNFVRNNSLEYNSENSFVFPGGKEWRWLDLRSLRLLGDRVDSASNKKNSVDMYVKPDIDHNGKRYIYFSDLNGQYLTTTYETINPYWQGDYATAHFTFVTPSQTSYPDKDLYLIGQLTDYQLTDENKMKFNAEKGVYEGIKFLKQGYYNYGYLLTDKKDPAQRMGLEGNNWETENVYTILVYYRSFSDQFDRLIGVANINSRIDKPGFSF